MMLFIVNRVIYGWKKLAMILNVIIAVTDQKNRVWLKMNNPFLNTVKWIHIELSSRCNAWCPSCPRNVDGFKLVDGLIERDLSLVRLREIVDTLPMLKTVQICGNYGDPIAAKNILEVLDFLISKKYFIHIHTNGSLKTQEWWAELGNKIKNIEHLVFFALDGLEDTHEIYRQGTNYNKIIDNANAFISNGGKAVWQFIPFAHNEHQIKEAFLLSKKLKFHSFKIIKNPRVNLNARHYKTGKLLNLKPWSNYVKFSDNLTNHSAVGKSCMHLEYPSLYINADGRISTCCFISDIEYTNEMDIETELKTNSRPECKKNCNF
jgi:MoaA/NifB/PqqE/SkfB family radical SAM enzyme